MPTRRQFIKTGIAGGVLLTAAYVLHRPLDRLGKDALVAARPLDASLRKIVAALAPVILAGAATASGPEFLRRVSDGVAIAVSGLSAPAQREVAELFALLDFAPTRVVVAGLRDDWGEAEAADLRAFLERWRHSPLDLLKSGYMALHDLIYGAWYGYSGNWAAIGYPGPPEVPRA